MRLCVHFFGISLMVIFAFPWAATAQSAEDAEDLTVLSPDEQPGELLQAYLLRECDKLLDVRREEVRALETPEAVRERIDPVRKDWMTAIGPFPERTPLNGKTVGVIEADGYRIERVLYESRPGHHVTGNLYLPEGDGPFPGVLVPCGHSGNGKAAGAYQSACILLARHGFVTLIYDPFGQGERYQLLDENGKPVIGGTTEHTLADIGARLTGACAANYRIWDGIRSLDYLIERPEVDPERIGCTGNSGGGTLTAYLMATDDRILAAAPSCYITSLSRLFNTIGPQDGEQNVTAQVALGIDHVDYVTMRAPKPTLILTGTYDFFDIDGSWDTFREAKRVYGILGFGERVSLFEYPDKHGFSQPRREAALRWMRRWLQGIDDAPTEVEPVLQTDEALQVTEPGQVVADFRGRTVWDLSLDRAKELAADREAFWRDHSKEECLAEVRRLAGIREITEKPVAKSLGIVEREGYTIEKLRIEREGEPPVPGLLFLPAAREGKLPAVLYVDGRGKQQASAPGGPIEELVREGRAVLAIDVRGTGETAIAKPRQYRGNEYKVTYLGIHLGRPLPGQRAEDVLAALEVLVHREEVAPRQIRLVGIECGGPVALHAAALDPRLAEVVIEEAIESWMDVVATPLARAQLEQIVPNALTRYDLPDLIRAIAPRALEVRQPVDPTGRPTSEAK
ncbi:MAG: acetylxylan esterase [Thermoguttaceae bacterium]|jgi:cephalosporin-C deacetylase-like acetyl esterase|nr:acetylxylan esterase [Thermoguttaceae bacterium]